MVFTGNKEHFFLGILGNNKDWWRTISSNGGTGRLRVSTYCNFGGFSVHLCWLFSWKQFQFFHRTFIKVLESLFAGLFLWLQRSLSFQNPFETWLWPISFFEDTHGLALCLPRSVLLKTHLFGFLYCFLVTLRFLAAAEAQKKAQAAFLGSLAWSLNLGI